MQKVLRSVLKRMERDASAVIKDANDAVFVRVADFVEAHVMKAPKVEFFGSSVLIMSMPDCVRE